LSDSTRCTARPRFRRLGRQRDTGAPGFGNARAVRNAYEAAITRQSARVLAERRAGGAPDPLLISRDDLLGPKRIDPAGSPALRELAGMRGLQKVKDSVDTLLGLIECVCGRRAAERARRVAASALLCCLLACTCGADWIARLAWLLPRPAACSAGRAPPLPL
jgi:hypothetical protein